jgi:RNA-directed DNA polymerase
MDGINTNVPYKSPKDKEATVHREVGAVRSSVEGPNQAGAKGPYLNKRDSVKEDEVIGPYEGLIMPSKVQELQRTLYRKAKAEPRWRAWSLYGHVCRRDVLESALDAVVKNKGAAGFDGISTDTVKAAKDAFLKSLQEKLMDRSYKPGPVLRTWIPKADGKQRPLGIPNVVDRIVQMAVLLVLNPIFEADFDEGSYGYRPGRKAVDAVDAIREELRHGRTELIDADLSGYFDTIDHTKLLNLVAKRVSDGSILRLIKLFLKAPIVERKNGKVSYHKNDRGTPQGGVLSPLLANLYLNDLDHGVNDKPELDAKIIRYADDFVLLTRPGKAAGLLERLKKYLVAKKLQLNETKTRLVKFRKESFNFLGFNFSWRRSGRTLRNYVHVEPSPKATIKFKDKVRAELSHWTKHLSCKEAVERVNSIARGWANFYDYGNCSATFRQQQTWLRNRVRRWMWRKYDCTHALFEFFTDQRLTGQYNLWSFPTKPQWLR